MSVGFWVIEFSESQQMLKHTVKSVFVMKTHRRCLSQSEECLGLRQESCASHSLQTLEIEKCPAFTFQLLY